MTHPDGTPGQDRDPGELRIANCSGFYGDRLSAAREMVEGGPIDVLTGDWLAELTMLLLAKARDRGAPGYARTFLTQMEQVLGTCLDRGIKIVSNAGGLDPAGCAAAVEELAARLGVSPRVAYVTGDDLVPRLGDLGDLPNVDTGERLSELDVSPITANAYLGGGPIAEALHRGADVVVTGRVTDAALVVGPGMWHFGWSAEGGPDHLDALAGAVAAGHVIECGCQATGGNYAFFTAVPDLAHVGFPLAELRADGSAVITKHPGTGGRVSVGTVTAQLLYEIAGPRYLSPDAVARFDTIRLEGDGPDRVRVYGTGGDQPPPELKVAINYAGGYRNAMTLVLTGLDIAEKARAAEDAIWARVPGGRDAYEHVATEVVGTDPALLRIAVLDRDRRKVGRAFSAAVVETGLASYPGFFAITPPGDASSYGVYWPAVVPVDAVTQRVVVGDEEIPVPHARPGAWRAGPALTEPVGPERAERAGYEPAPAPSGPTVRAPLGRVAGARSGDKGGNANLGVWVPTAPAYAWLDEFLTVERLRELLPEAADRPVERHALPNLLALNFVVVGLLGRGVAANTRFDPQAKALGERLRGCAVDVPEILLTEAEGDPHALHR